MAPVGSWFKTFNNQPRSDYLGAGITKGEEMSKEEEIGATLCDDCDKMIYESEFYLAENGDVVCSSCFIERGDTDNL